MKTMMDQGITGATTGFNLMYDKRKYERIAMGVPVIVELLVRRRKKRVYLFQTVNVSAGGVLICTAQRFPLGVPVRVHIVLTFDEKAETEENSATLVIDATGYINRLEPQGLAICFNEDYQLISWRDALSRVEGLNTH